jgi:putative FmdB family regulatory protein
LSHLLSPCDEPRAKSAVDELLVQGIDGGHARGGVYPFTIASLAATRVESVVPVYEYEPEGRECFLCDGRVAAIQGLSEEPLRHCPWCGLDVRRVISRATFKLATGGAEAAARKGFTTWRRTEKGSWEKVAGSGVDAIVGAPEDVAAVEAEQRAARVLDLDKDS